LAEQAREELKNLTEKIKTDVAKAKSKRKSVITDVEETSETDENQ
jgi:F0F1-type ATP synthase membrane subunit b/b'